jgi:hypothetical protein
MIGNFGVTSGYGGNTARRLSREYSIECCFSYRSWGPFDEYFATPSSGRTFMGRVTVERVTVERVTVSEWSG